MRNIVFVGLMGAGKTTMGRRLAKRHGLPFIDTDQEIERRCGASIPTIFDLEGEEGFRKRESKVIADVMQVPGQVVTTGGGAVLAPENRSVLKQGFVIYLDATPAHLWIRLKSDSSRPLLAKSTDPEATLAELHQKRDPLYKEIADLIEPTGQASVSVVMRVIERGLIKAGVLTS